MRDLIMKTGDGFVFVYSIKDRSAFESLEGLYKNIVGVRDTEDVPAIVVGDDCEQESHRVVSQEDGHTFADKIGVDFMEVSSEEGRWLDDIFITIVRRINEHKARVGGNKKKECLLQ